MNVTVRLSVPPGSPPAGVDPLSSPAAAPVASTEASASSSSGARQLVPATWRERVRSAVARDRSGARVRKVVAAVIVAAPPLAAAAAVKSRVGPSRGALVWGAAAYVTATLGVTVSLHRYLTHRSFKTSPSGRVALTVLGALAVEGSPVQWAANHRFHHQVADTPQDVHSPHADCSPGATAFEAFTHAYVGWLFTPTGIDPQRYAPDLAGDRLVTRVDRLWPVIAVSGALVAPAVFGLAVGGRRGALRYLAYGSLLPIGAVHHVTWLVDTVCHMSGRRHFATRDRSTDVAWLAVPSLGGSWHNGHHAEPTSAREGLLVGQLDVSAEVIRLAEHAGLVWDVRWPDPQRVARKLADPSLTVRLRPLPSPARRGGLRAS